MGIRRVIGSAFRRVRWLHVLAAVWLAGVAVYWWYRVPPVADVVIPLRPDDQAWGYTSRGDIVVSRGPARDIGWKAFGPVDVVNSSTGEVKARRLEEGEMILAWPYGGEHIAAFDEHGVQVVELESGRVVISLPTSDADPSAVFSLDGRSVAVGLGNTVSMYSLETGERRWTREFTVGQYAPSDQRSTALAIEVTLHAAFRKVLRVDLNSFDLAGGKAFSTRVLPREFLSVDSGLPDFRFGPKVQVNESPDGRLAIVGSQADDQFVYDLIEGRTLWEMGSVASWREFSPDSQEVRELSIADGRPMLRRWRAVDGTPLQEADGSRNRSHLDGMVSQDGRFIVGLVEREGINAPRWVRILCSSFKTRWDGVILPSGEDLSLIDRSTGRILVLASQRESNSRKFSDNLTFGALDRERFTVHEADRVSVFRFDASRNWWWLAGWGLGPVVVGIVFIRLKRGNRSASYAQLA